MVTMAQAINGFKRYVDEQILPHLDGIKQIGAATYMALALDGAGEKLLPYMDLPAIRMLGVVDAEHQIDIAKLADTVRQQMKDGKVDIRVPMIGVITFRESDVQRLREMIERA